MRVWLERGLARLWWRDRPAPLPTLLLGPLSLLYRLLWCLSRLGARTARPLPVPVLVVGNHVVGGAGKTPTVLALIPTLRAAGYSPGVISRGHGRQGNAPREVLPDAEVRQVGDEPLLIARRSGVPVWVGRRRRDTAMALLVAHPEVDLLVSDDGLQHRALPRQAEVVVFDERGAGNGRLLPAGPLREPLPVDVPPWRRVLYTAGMASTPLPGGLARRCLGRAWPLAAWQAADASQAVPLTALKGRQLLAAAGLAAPEKFFSMLRAAGLDFTALPLPDHHPFDQEPWPSDTPDVLVTEKDAVKLRAGHCGSTRVWVVPLDLIIPPALLDELLALLPPRRTAKGTACPPPPMP